MPGKRNEGEGGQRRDLDTYCFCHKLHSEEDWALLPVMDSLLFASQTAGKIHPIRDGDPEASTVPVPKAQGRRQPLGVLRASFPTRVHIAVPALGRPQSDGGGTDWPHRLFSRMWGYRPFLLSP